MLLLVAFAAATPPVRAVAAAPAPPLWGAVGPRVYDDVGRAIERAGVGP